jgi:small subunit ribosomal protein S4e
MKRQNVPKSWAIEKKGTKFILKSGERGIPLLIVLRDLLKIAKNRREIKKALIKKDILVCGKVAKDEKKQLFVRDTISLLPSKKHFRLIYIKGGKFDAIEINEKESLEKFAKVIGKKILKGKKVQLNLFDGRNYLTKQECNVNDSVLIDLKENKIKKCIKLKNNSKAAVIGGKYCGRNGIIVKIDEKGKIAELKSDEEKINVLLEHLMAVE